jgi:hypothetical protein
LHRGDILILLGVTMVPLGLALVILVGDYLGLIHINLAFVIFGMIVSLGAGLVTAGVLLRKTH